MFRVAKHLMKAVIGDSVDVSETDGVRALHLGSATIQSAMRIREPFALEPVSYTHLDSAGYQHNSNAYGDGSQSGATRSTAKNSAAA